MRITVQYMGQVRHVAGAASPQEIDVPERCSVLECVRLLATQGEEHLRHFLLDREEQLSRTILLFADDTQVRDAGRVILKDGDVLTLLSPISGG